VHAQLLEGLRPFSFPVARRFLTIQSLEFQDVWQKIARNHINKQKTIALALFLTSPVARATAHTLAKMRE